MGDRSSGSDHRASLQRTTGGGPKPTRSTGPPCRTHPQPEGATNGRQTTHVFHTLEGQSQRLQPAGIVTSRLTATAQTRAEAATTENPS